MFVHLPYQAIIAAWLKCIDAQAAFVFYSAFPEKVLL